MQFVQLNTLNELLYKCVLLIKIKRKVVELDEAVTQQNEVKCIIKDHNRVLKKVSPTILSPTYHKIFSLASILKHI